jgi:uridine phosphorylase
VETSIGRDNHLDRQDNNSGQADASPVLPHSSPREGWYLHCREGDIAERVVLVGDPGRIEHFSRLLDQPRTVNTNRGLLAVSGSYQGVAVSVVAFGMGAPILAVVLEEVAWLGAKIVLRAGTAMSVSEGWYGRFIVTTAALREESTSLTYLPASYPAAADQALNQAVTNLLTEKKAAWGYGLMASYDGFYSQMFALDPARQAQVLALRHRLRSLKVAAVDMETSALLAIGRYLGLQCGSLCLVTVDGPSQTALEGSDRIEGESNLLDFALASVARCSIAQGEASLTRS